MLEMELSKTLKMAPIEKLESALYLYTFKKDVKKEAKKMYLRKALLHPTDHRDLKEMLQEQINKLEQDKKMEKKHLQKLLNNYKKMQLTYLELNKDLEVKKNNLNAIKKGIV